MAQKEVEQAIELLLPTDMANSSLVAKEVAKRASKEAIARHNEAVAARTAAVIKEREKKAKADAEAKALKAETAEKRAKQAERAEQAEEAYLLASATQQLLDGDNAGVLAGKMTEADGARFLASANRSTSNRDIQKLLSSLNINMNLQLTKNDTAQLLACLLTANETQLNLLMNNKKIPIAIKIVVKRLLTDAKDGTMSSLERIWDRVFGNQPMTDSLSPTLVARETIQRSIMPEVPVSRETFEIIKREIYGVSAE